MYPGTRLHLELYDSGSQAQLEMHTVTKLHWQPAMSLSLGGQWHCRAAGSLRLCRALP